LGKTPGEEYGAGHVKAVTTIEQSLETFLRAWDPVAINAEAEAFGQIEWMIPAFERS
jgi:hypothetical protein